MPERGRVSPLKYVVTYITHSKTYYCINWLNMLFMVFEIKFIYNEIVNSKFIKENIPVGVG